MIPPQCKQYLLVVIDGHYGGILIIASPQLASMWRVKCTLAWNSLSCTCGVSCTRVPLPPWPFFRGGTLQIVDACA